MKNNHVRWRVQFLSVRAYFINIFCGLLVTNTSSHDKLYDISFYILFIVYSHFLGLETKPKRPITDQYTDFDKYKKSGAPMPISDPPIISQMTDRHCTLSWKPSIPSGPREPVTYQLEMCELPHGDWFTVRSGIRSCTCGVRNLEPFRDYKFRVRVENKYGISDPSPYAITHR